MSLIRSALPHARPRHNVISCARRIGPIQRCFSKDNKNQAVAAESTVSETIQPPPDLLRSLLRGSGAPSTFEQVKQKLPGSYARDELSRAKRLADSTPMTLREACKCTKCVDPGDNQRHFVWADIPSNISIASCEVNSNGTYTVTWQNDLPGYDSDHVSTYTKAEIEQLGQLSPKIVADFGQRSKRLWDSTNFDTEANTVSYHDYMNDEAGLARLLHLVARDGLAFISEIPSEPESVNKMAERVGPIRNTFYGETWDCKSMPDATNVAYTSRYLGFHMDMLYVREPPCLQFLHCLHNTCTGGESRFADTFKAADQVVSRGGEAAFNALETMKVKYYYKRPGVFTSAVKPVFDTEAHESKPPHNFTNAQNPDLINKLHRIYWSPPWTDRAMANDETADAVSQLQASKSFHDVLNDESNVVQTKLPPGTCAVFDNFRVVHSRQAFDLNSGERFLRVAYVDDADFQSRSMTLREKMPSDA